MQLSSSVSPVGDLPRAATDPVLEFYMRDILGGPNPMARPITSLLGHIYNGHIPFTRPIRFGPPEDGIPHSMGLSGSSFNPTQAQAHLSPDGLGLGFGTVTVIDDALTDGQDLRSPVVGKARGVYVASSPDGATQMMAFTAVMEGGESSGDSINFFGVYKSGATTSSHLSVTGGTGKFKNAGGFAEVRWLGPATGAVEASLRISVHLTY
ncbi:hypothetical protein QJS04_geneDACA002260 [Acorus gramineus]|uniref:Dirigent protein n=1 Tax=Acorus gramineus TaxID=55184 RepID=A0AAV9A8E0_ACOGR|nr:hypothetical protein QJS04_geneDACA002260 [Acorus gramineus]